MLPQFAGDRSVLEALIAEHKAKLVIIEPLAAFLCGPDANKDQEIRRVLYKLSKLAEKYNCAIIVLRHLNKGGKAIYRGNRPGVATSRMFQRRASRCLPSRLQ
jgi:RecA-family ATPase